MWSDPYLYWNVRRCASSQRKHSFVASGALLLRAGRIPKGAHAFVRWAMQLLSVVLQREDAEVNG